MAKATVAMVNGTEPVKGNAWQLIERTFNLAGKQNTEQAGLLRNLGTVLSPENLSKKDKPIKSIDPTIPGMAAWMNYAYLPTLRTLLAASKGTTVDPTSIIKGTLPDGTQIEFSPPPDLMALSKQISPQNVQRLEQLVSSTVAALAAAQKSEQMIKFAIEANFGPTPAQTIADAYNGGLLPDVLSEDMYHALVQSHGGSDPNLKLLAELIASGRVLGEIPEVQRAGQQQTFSPGESPELSGPPEEYSEEMSYAP